MNLNSLPAWVPNNLKRVIRKATHIDPSKRFPTASAFHVQLNNLKSNIPNWVVENGIPTLHAATSFKVYVIDGTVIIKKCRGAGQWRKDNSFTVNNVKEAVEQINAKA